MSYDLTVYCPDAPTIEKVLLLVGNTRGIQADPSAPKSGNAPGSVQVLRGVKRGYSFTVDGPFTVRPEDVPEEVSTVLSNAETMFQVLVEGTVDAEIPHGVRFARNLAKACHGLVLDEQTSEVWPVPRKPKDDLSWVPKVYPRVDAVEFAWYCLADEMPPDLPQRYLRLAGEFIPQALPVRFGTYYPLQGDFARDGAGGFTKAWEELVGNWLDLNTTYPVTWASMGSVRDTVSGDVRHIRMTVAGEALGDTDFRAAMKEFFVRFSIESRAFHATAEVLHNYTLERNELRSDVWDPERFRYSSLRGYQWAGLKPHPLWWMWFGPLYSGIVRPHLTGRLEEHPEGIFHAWTEAPADRHIITELLKDPAQPWVPAEYSPVYEEGVVEPVSIAESMPQRLRETRVEPHRWTEE